MMQKENNNVKNDEKKVFTSAQINWYPGHMAKAKRLISEKLNLIDVVYEVVDARMPYSSKIKDIDSFIKNKPRIIIFNKMDLCDKLETSKWIKYYESKGYKVITLSLEKNPDMKLLLKATDELMKESNQKRENKGMIKRKTRILIVGIPNVGKSTLINRLVGKKAVNVGNKPGVTKTLDWIRINDNMELLDSPGVLWPKLDEEKVAFNLASLTAIKEEILPLYEVSEYIINTLYKYYPEILNNRFGIDNIDDDFITTLERIGKKRGCLMRGGEIDYDKVISIIMNDLKSGIIKNITFDRIEDYI